jgi:hypothetical protein
MDPKKYEPHRDIFGTASSQRETGISSTNEARLMSGMS